MTEAALYCPHRATVIHLIDPSKLTGFSLHRVAWLILECARRTSTYLSCAFREQEDDQAAHPFLLRPRVARAQRAPAWLACLYLNPHLFGFRNHFLDRADHVERLFREMVIFAIKNFLEASHRVFELHVLTGRAGKGFGNVERL